MSENYSLEVHRRVYDEAEGHYVTVCPDGDVPRYVLLMTDNDQREHWGDIRLTLHPAMARLLGQALIAAAEEAGTPQ